MKQFVWIRDVVIIITFMVVLRSSIVNWYVIPTGSMLPTIKIRDHVLVNKLSYGLMLPFMGYQIVSWDAPKRGDIVLFDSPKDHITFVKRVVGLGGDTVTFDNGVLQINSERVKEVLQEDRGILADMGDQTPCNNGDGKNLYVEKFSDKASEHYILRTVNGGNTNLETRTWSVPDGKLLVVGDNRDCSNDGRYWGYVDVDKIYGKAVRVFYSINTSEGRFPSFRTDRFFAKLQ
ncbi:MAG: signal peptidase [Pseudomonadota bacterium]|jgi:signal peptidase I